MIVDTGISIVQGAGFSGTTAAYLTPKWRGNATLGYESDTIGADIRARYIQRSKFAPTTLVATIGDFSYPSYTYFDLGLRAYFPFGSDENDRVTLYGSVANLFDRKPPLAIAGTAYYDVVGRYFTIGANVKF